MPKHGSVQSWLIGFPYSRQRFPDSRCLGPRQCPGYTLLPSITPIPQVSVLTLKPCLCLMGAAWPWKLCLLPSWKAIDTGDQKAGFRCYHSGHKQSDTHGGSCVSCSPHRPLCRVLYLCSAKPKVQVKLRSKRESLHGLDIAFHLRQPREP